MILHVFCIEIHLNFCHRVFFMLLYSKLRLSVIGLFRPFFGTKSLKICGFREWHKKFFHYFIVLFLPGTRKVSSCTSNGREWSTTILSFFYDSNVCYIMKLCLNGCRIIQSQRINSFFQRNDYITFFYVNTMWCDEFLNV